MQTFLAKIAVILATFSGGAFLRTTGFLNTQDAQAAGLALTYGTFPSLVLQTLLTYGFIGWEGAAIGICALLLNLFLATVAWYAFGKRRISERALLTASTVGVAVGSLSYAFVEAAFSPAWLHFAVLWDLGNMLSVCLLSYFILAKGGNPVPEQYLHADGGTYRGQWKGSKKHGLGVYTYPGGGRFEGRWAENLKEGLGVYTFPKGGWYEGEWRRGERSGRGVRIFRSGTIQAGLWDGSKVIERMEPSECSFAATSAREVAAAAKKVPVGGDAPQDVALQLLKQPAFWAVALAAASISTSYNIPVALDFLTAHLATAHIPLALLVFGLNTELQLPASHQVADVANSLALRILLPLAAAAVAALALPLRYTDVVATIAICSVGPISEQMPYFVQLFRLNEAIHGRILSASRIASFASLAILVFVMVVATPPESAISRSQLAIALTIALSVLTITGSVAVWWLSSNSAAPKGGQGTAAARSVRAQAVSPTVEQTLQPEGPAGIPVGIAWQERREAAGASTAAAPSTAKEVPTADGNVQLGVIDTGEGRRVGEASIVSAWDEAGNVLMGSQDESSVDASTESIDMEQAGDFDLGGRRPDVDSALPSTSMESKGEEAAESGSGKPSSARRRRSSGRPFQDVDDESTIGPIPPEGFLDHPVTHPEPFGGSHRRPRQRGHRYDALRAPRQHSHGVLPCPPKFGQSGRLSMLR